MTYADFNLHRPVQVHCDVPNSLFSGLSRSPYCVKDIYTLSPCPYTISAAQIAGFHRQDTGENLTAPLIAELPPTGDRPIAEQQEATPDVRFRTRNGEQTPEDVRPPRGGGRTPKAVGRDRHTHVGQVWFFGWQVRIVVGSRNGSRRI